MRVRIEGDFDHLVAQGFGQKGLFRFPTELFVLFVDVAGVQRDRFLSQAIGILLLLCAKFGMTVAQAHPFNRLLHPIHVMGNIGEDSENDLGAKMISGGELSASIISTFIL